jgi:hypothetical protein
MKAGRGQSQNEGVSPPVRPGLVFGYGGGADGQVEDGLRRLRASLASAIGLAGFSPAKVNPGVDKPSGRADHAATASTVNPPRERKGVRSNPSTAPSRHGPGAPH